MAKPAKTKFVADLKSHITATYPGAVIKSTSVGHAIHLDPIETNPDFFIAVHDREGLLRMAGKAQQQREAAAAKKQEAEAKKRQRESEARRKKAERDRAARNKPKTSRSR